MTSSKESDRIAAKPGHLSDDHLRIDTRDDGQGSRVYFCRDPAGRLWSFGPNHSKPRRIRHDQAHPFDSTYPARNFVIAALMVSFLGGWAMVAHNYPGTFSQSSERFRNLIPGNNAAHSREWETESTDRDGAGSSFTHQIRPNSKSAVAGSVQTAGLKKRIGRLESELKQTFKILEAARTQMRDDQQRQQQTIRILEQTEHSVRQLQKELD
ncbi:MAG: hypothetical protein ACR2OW_03950, partial [Methyloligellaceae bacterium]